MKKLLIIFLLLICVGCSQRESKNINLVCDGSFTAHNVEGIPEKSFNLHINGDKYNFTQGDSEVSGSCNWTDTEITCTSDKSLATWVKLDRYSLLYRSRYDTVTSEGRCKVIEKAI
jgi:hypothetical protein